MRRGTYPSDLSDAEWARLQPFVPPAATGRSRTRDLRAIVDGIVYVLRTGCQGRYRPETSGPWSTVSSSFHQGRQDGTWPVVLDALRRAERVRRGRHPEASGLLLDSQTVKTTEKGGSAARTAASGSRAASGTC